MKKRKLENWRDWKVYSVDREVNGMPVRALQFERKSHRGGGIRTPFFSKLADGGALGPDEIRKLGDELREWAEWPLEEFTAEEVVDYLRELYVRSLYREGAFKWGETLCLMPHFEWLADGWSVRTAARVDLDTLFERGDVCPYEDRYLFYDETAQLTAVTPWVFRACYLDDAGIDGIVGRTLVTGADVEAEEHVRDYLARLSGAVPSEDVKVPARSVGSGWLWTVHLDGSADLFSPDGERTASFPGGATSRSEVEALMRQAENAVVGMFDDGGIALQKQRDTEAKIAV